MLIKVAPGHQELNCSGHENLISSNATFVRTFYHEIMQSSRTSYFLLLRRLSHTHLSKNYEKVHQDLRSRWFEWTRTKYPQEVSHRKAIILWLWMTPPLARLDLLCHGNININALKPEQNGRHFCRNNFQMRYLRERYFLLIHISLKFVPRCPIDNMSALVQVMACHMLSAKPLPEAVMTQFIDAYMHHKASMH